MRFRLLSAFAPALFLALPAQSQTCADRSPDYAARITLCDQAFAAAQSDADAADALALKGEAQRLSGDLDGAAATLQQALALTPTSAWLWVELGNVRYDQRDTAGALAHYSAALAVEDYADAWANRADAWWEFRLPQSCADDADQALRLDPKYPYANEIKGRCLIDLGRADEAISYFDTAIALAPGYQNAYRNKMAALAALDRPEEVVALADLALRPETVPNSNPAIEEDILARRLLALASYAPTATLEAEAAALLRLYPENLAALNIQARALISAKNLAEADALTAPMRANAAGLPMEAVYFDTLAQIDVSLGRLDDALGNYEAALTADPALSKVYARKLAELGFLPISNAPPGVLTALRRCIDVKKTACLVAS
jgi:tetratricopeptide (TPR) repeat protein